MAKCWATQMVKQYEFTDDASNNLDPIASSSDILKSFHYSTYPQILTHWSSSKQALLELLYTNVNYLQIFALNHLIACDFRSDVEFVEFCKDCLTLDFEMNLKIAAIMYLSQTFIRTRMYKSLEFLMSVLLNLFKSSNSFSEPHGADPSYKLMIFTYATIELCLDEGFDLGDIPSDVVLTETMLEELDARINITKSGELAEDDI